MWKHLAEPHRTDHGRPRQHPAPIGIGDEARAQDYASTCAVAWLNTPGASGWRADSMVELAGLVLDLAAKGRR